MDYSKLNNIAASIQDVENAASIVENRLTNLDKKTDELNESVIKLNNHFTDNNSIKVGTAINVSGTDSIAGGAGVSLTGNRAFGYGFSMSAIYLTGDEGTYSARLYNTSKYDRQNNVAKVFAITHLNSYLLNTSNFSRVAKITNIVYNGENQPITLTLDTDLGNLSNAVYAIENVAGTKSFNAGCFGNTGQNSSVIGLNNFNTGTQSNILGSINANTADIVTVLGYLNKNNGNYSNILGSVNNNSAIYSNVIGLMNTNDSTGTYANIIGRNNTNKCSSTSIIGVGNTVNETTYPSVITGYENIADVATQQFTLGYGNHGTRGQYAEGNASASWMIGHHLTTSTGCWALGKYNKDYDVQDVAKQNFFVVGQGNSTRAFNNLEVKNNGNWYVYGIGGFDGTNSDNASIKPLHTVINGLETKSTNNSTAINTLQSTISNLNDKVDNNELVVSSSLVDLNEKVDNLTEKIDNNELVTASALTDLNDKIGYEIKTTNNITNPTKNTYYDLTGSAISTLDITNVSVNNTNEVVILFLTSSSCTITALATQRMLGSTSLASNVVYIMSIIRGVVCIIEAPLYVTPQSE